MGWMRFFFWVSEVKEVRMFSLFSMVVFCCNFIRFKIIDCCNDVKMWDFFVLIVRWVWERELFNDD